MGLRVGEKRLSWALYGKVWALGARVWASTVGSKSLRVRVRVWVFSQIVEGFAFGVLGFGVGV